MSIESLSGETFLLITTAAVNNLRVNSQKINDLNVFPVPDGDTGENMSRTMETGLDFARKIETDNIGDVADAFSHGALLGARGNSGVILSQFFKGVQEGLENKKEVSALELLDAYRNGVDHAYHAVVNPVEGTILTVFKESTEYAASHMDDDSTIEDFYKLHLEGAREILPKTKEMLPVLKEADVIDSGGAGYLCIVEGMYNALVDPSFDPLINSEKSFESQAQTVDIDAFTRDSVLDFGYCTECLLRLQTSKVNPDEFDVSVIIDFLKEMGGDSIVCYKEGDVVKLHVHTPNPGFVLTELRKYGEFLTVKIENMALQHQEIVNTKSEKKNVPHKKLAVVCVANGEGIINLFKEMGADEIIEGGQTGNPPSEAFIQAFERLNADYIVVLPNNPNIILTANQAAKMYDKAQVYVIPTTSFTQGNSALAVINPFFEDIEEMLSDVNSCIEEVVSCSVVEATKDAVINSLNIKKGDYLGMIEKEIVTTKATKKDALMSLIEKVPDIEDKELCTLFTGKDIDENEAEEIENAISGKYPDLEISRYDGKQDVYSFLISFE